jgi:hypothetical protein
MKLPPNLNCIVTCENTDEKIEFGNIFGFDYNKSSILSSDYYSFRITDSTHEYCNYDTESSYKNSKWKHYKFLTFKEFKAKYMQEEFILPTKWIINPLSHEFKIVNDWAINRSNRQGYKNFIFHSNVAYNQDGIYVPFQKSTITFEQFKKFVLKEKEMNKEIIGYKTPCDLWEGDVKKGTLYVKVPDFSKNYGLSTNIEEDGFYIPKEVVQTWEAVYKAQEYKGIVKGSNKSMSYSIEEQGLVHCDGKLIAIIDLKKFIAPQDSNLLPWISMGESWSIGCLEGVNREELQDIINQHNKLFNL